MIIDKKLTRLDGSKVSVKSFLDFRFMMSGKSIRFTLKHWINEKKEHKQISGVKEFKYVINYNLKEDEEKPRSEEQFEDLLKKLIGTKIGGKQFII